MAFDIAQARESLDARLRAQRTSRDRRFAQAWSDFHAIVSMLIAKYNPKRIYQWGSLLNKDRFSEISDIDIAVEGITDTETFFDLYGDADSLTRFSLDLVAIEKIEPEFADLIRTNGALVYERQEE